MKWVCTTLSFLWFCQSANPLMTEAVFESHLKFFSDLDIVLTVPKKICSEIDTSGVGFGSAGHIVHDERLNANIGKARVAKTLFLKKIPKCFQNCICGALLTLENKVEPALEQKELEVLKEKLELLTNDYYRSCQAKRKLTCASKTLKAIVKAQRGNFFE